MHTKDTELRNFRSKLNITPTNHAYRSELKIWNGPSREKLTGDIHLIRRGGNTTPVAWGNQITPHKTFDHGTITKVYNMWIEKIYLLHTRIKFNKGGIFELVIHTRYNEIRVKGIMFHKKIALLLKEIWKSIQKCVSYALHYLPHFIIRILYIFTWK